MALFTLTRSLHMLTKYSINNFIEKGKKTQEIGKNSVVTLPGRQNLQKQKCNDNNKRIKNIIFIITSLIHNILIFFCLQLYKKLHQKLRHQH